MPETEAFGRAPASSEAEAFRRPPAPIDLGALNLLRRSATALTAWPLLALLWIYRTFVSPALPSVCRYYPSCSRYAAAAIAMHGPVRGAWLAARRLLRCHPWAPGGPDPVPSPRRAPGRLPAAAASSRRASP